MPATVDQRRPAAAYRAPAHWLNPRRRLHVEIILEYLPLHGAKIHLSPGDEHYAALLAERQIHQHQVDAALDDAYELGLIDITAWFDGSCFVHLLSRDIDAALRSSIAEARRARGIP